MSEEEEAGGGGTPIAVLAFPLIFFLARFVREPAHIRQRCGFPLLRRDAIGELAGGLRAAGLARALEPRRSAL